MSQIEVSIRPPPRRTGFVSGYPGIPPCSSRPQATIKGAVELKIPPEGVRAKWVRIELLRVERLPSSAGGSERRFEVCVGPGPITLWSAAEEYTTLTAQKFPFSIRIPESLPPSINMEGGAGVGYELEASVCIAVKGRLLPLSKSMVIKSTSPITIDKHELHSIWPVYLQAETRSTTTNGFTLDVERSQKCYGPGDRIAVTARIKSDNDDSAVLQEFEISLNEVITFKAGRLSPASRTEHVISSGEVALNATLCRGISYSAELSCMLCSTHATATLYSARHIDVAHSLCVKATMDNGIRLSIDLPVVISNWKHDVSDAAIKRIGPIPSLSLLSKEKIQDTLPTEPRVGTIKITPNRHRSGRKKDTSPEISKGSHATVIINREESHSGPSSATGSTTSDSQHDEHPVPPKTDQGARIERAWPTVDEEKRLYEQATSHLKEVRALRPPPPPIQIPKPLPRAPTQQKSSVSLASEYASGSTSAISQPSKWLMSAKEEKEMLQRGLDSKGSPLSGVSEEEDGPPPPEYFRLFPNSRLGYLSDKPSPLR